MRLPELGEKVVKLQPLPKNLFSHSLPDVGTSTGEGRVIGHENRDLSEISIMFGRDFSECRVDPVDPPRSDSKTQIFEPRHLQEVD